MANCRREGVCVTDQAQKSRESVLRPLAWVGIITVTALVLLLVLVPYYGWGWHFPTTPPGTDPDRPDEFYAISLFRSTLWENRFWSDLFWRVGCNAWCAWLPALLLAAIEMRRSWATLSEKGKLIRVVGMIIILMLGGLWFIASLDLFGEIVD
jgi:hypothetical protein